MRMLQSLGQVITPLSSSELIYSCALGKRVCTARCLFTSGVVQ